MAKGGSEGNTSSAKAECKVFWQIECNAPLSTHNARVEKEFTQHDMDGDDSFQRTYVPRAHDTAVEQSEMAMRRRHEQEEKL